jgi:hypothetical protein
MAQQFGEHAGALDVEAAHLDELGDVGRHVAHAEDDPY